MICPAMNTASEGRKSLWQVIFYCFFCTVNWGFAYYILQNNLTRRALAFAEALFVVPKENVCAVYWHL
jgi:hypothetical protein